MSVPVLARPLRGQRAMGELLEIHLAPGDPAGGRRLAQLINAQSRQERATAARRTWTLVVALASIPLSGSTLFGHVLGRGLVRTAAAVWTVALFAVLATALGEWRSHRRVRALLSGVDARVTSRPD